ncbi:MAG TPA: hypothetical protein EYO74_01540 [Piscirickettsiaceae bacterium]|nr:hypothetical protein [Piscirickettsiaceae bacterium]
MQSNNLLTLRVKLDSIEKECGLGGYLEVEKSIIAFIAYQEKTHIAEILENQYFKKVSLNTVNRTVKKLRQEGVILATKAHSGDLRIVYLSLRKDWNLA